MRTRNRFLLPLGIAILVSTGGNTKTVDTCFSPLGHCDQVLKSWIQSSRFRLEGAIYGLTDPEIAQALIDAHRRGVKVRLIHDRSQSKNHRAVWKELRDAGVPIHIQRGSRGGIQHNKFLIIDSTYVITGSFNWTTNASRKNDENFVILDDEAPKFQMEFERLWSQSQSRSTGPYPFGSSSHRKKKHRTRKIML